MAALSTIDQPTHLSSLLDGIPIIDTDSHIIEPPDVWTARMARKWADVTPRVDTHPKTGNPTWHIGDLWLSEEAFCAHAGWKEFVPGFPPSFEQAEQGCYEPHARLERMDQDGIHAQVLYPNLLGVELQAFMLQKDPQFSLDCVVAYNDFVTDFSSADPERFIPITVLPFWDREASVAEMIRCAAKGHRGVLWPNKLELADMPSFTDPYWDPVYATAQEMNLSVNFHIQFAGKGNFDSRLGIGEKTLTDIRKGTKEDPPDAEQSRAFVRASLPVFLSNGYTILDLITSDVCAKFPDLKFVSVESGFGYVPYILENADWNWLNWGAKDSNPDRLMPSEYFVRQCYGTFWFEKVSLPLLKSYPDNFMFETDYPHPTSLTPGPGSYADSPRGQIDSAFGSAGLPDDVVRKALYENAAKVYGLTAVTATVA